MAAWLIVLVVLVLAAVWLSSRVLTRNDTASALPTSSAVLILEERFARGEITVDEFERRRRALQE